ncbi:hypothetical protein ACIBHY_51605 [Nonomuraea sp. NPDC050547]|uniref:hypothetical protein n=1 Tax=Nonomuraea sp. NPDC050547 TaxID=3364368 RepID=UPI003796A95F
MPTFDTPGPISVTVEVAAADVTVSAGASARTTAEVRPRDPAGTSDVAAAERVAVEFADGRLSVKDRSRTWFKRGLRPRRGDPRPAQRLRADRQARRGEPALPRPPR